MVFYLQFRLISRWGNGDAGAIAQALIYPIDLVKTRLQCHSEPGRAPHLVKFTRDILANEGPRALFRGLLPSLLGIIPYAGIDLATYETLKIKSRQFLPPDTGMWVKAFSFSNFILKFLTLIETMVDVCSS